MVNCSQRGFIEIVKPLLLLFFCLVEEAQGRSMEVGIENISTNCVPEDVEGKNEKIDMYDFPVHDYIQERNGSPYVLSFDNTNRCLFQERLLRSKNFATMVTWRHTSPLCFTSFEAIS